MKLTITIAIPNGANISHAVYQLRLLCRTLWFVYGSSPVILSVTREGTFNGLTWKIEENGEATGASNGN